jgi:hypothetical protein
MADHEADLFRHYQRQALSQYRVEDRDKRGLARRHAHETNLRVSL